MGRNRATLLAATAVALVLVLAGCAPNAPQDTLNPAGPVARSIDNLFRPVFWIAVGVFVLVEGLLVFALWRFRHRPGSPVPVQVHGNRRLEIIWTAAPALLLGAIAIPTVATIFSLSARPAGEVLAVNVTARQFWWEAEYRGLGVVTANEIHVPTGRWVFIRLNSKDVIHSFWVPRLSGKIDVVPGRPVVPGKTNALYFRADRPGTYPAQCAEYCGLSHANMRFRVVAQAEGDFRAWLEDQRRPVAAQPPPEVVAVFRAAGCAGCHALNGVEGFTRSRFGDELLGPDLTHFASRNTFAGSVLETTPENLALWLRDPQAVKPGNDMQLPRRLTEEEVRALVAYLLSLT